MQFCNGGDCEQDFKNSAAYNRRTTPKFWGLKSSFRLKHDTSKYEPLYRLDL